MFKELASKLAVNFGFNVLPLNGKKPTIQWERWQTEKQSINDIESMDWNCSGVSAVMGIENLRCFDFDGVENFELVEKFREALKFSEQYDWLVQSGSGMGYHIYFYCEWNEELEKLLGSERAVIKFKSKTDGYCKHIELRWKDCYTVLPYSTHPSGGIYTFLGNDPFEKPIQIEPQVLIECLKEYCVIKENTKLVINESESIKDAADAYYDEDKLFSALEFLADSLGENCYEDWLRIGFALVPLEKTGEDFFVQLSKRNPHYTDTEDEVRNKFADLKKKYDGRITPGTIFFLAKEKGWKPANLKFWYRDNKITRISRTKVKRLLEEYGYGKIKIGNEYIFVKVENNIVNEMRSAEVKEFILAYLNQIPADDFEGTTREAVLDALMKGSTQIFSDGFYEFLITRGLEFCEDTAETSYFFFKNVFVEVKKDAIVTKPYKELRGCIWERNIIRREYIITNNRSEFEDFLFNATGNDKDRMNALKSGIGFLLHRCKKGGEEKAVILIDEIMSEGASGRSGKGLTIKAISELRNVEPINGRTFNPTKSFAFQRVDIDTNIIAFEDLDEKFPFDKLFSTIADGITIERKGKDEIYLPYSKSPKIAITTNYSVKGVDDSTMARQFPIEYTGHYNKRHQPEHEFGHRFFESWNENQWNEFYQVMLEYCQYYLGNGLVAYKHINIEKKQLYNETCEEFYEFCSELSTNTIYNKKEIFERFKKENPELSVTQIKFTKWLKVWAKINDYRVNESKSGAERMIEFREGKAVA
ncbi:MAG: bifunctional DNA primase/polymerase [Ignavibacteriales bacterium]|nr:MAG: bifunctional DNA primase/polymerase [Ignavibacteriales bacterium]